MSKTELLNKFVVSNAINEEDLNNAIDVVRKNHKRLAIIRENSRKGGKPCIGRKEHKHTTISKEQSCSVADEYGCNELDLHDDVTTTEKVYTHSEEPLYNELEQGEYALVFLRDWFAVVERYTSRFDNLLEVDGALLYRALVRYAFGNSSYIEQWKSKPVENELQVVKTCFIEDTLPLLLERIDKCIAMHKHRIHNSVAHSRKCNGKKFSNKNI